MVRGGRLFWRQMSVFMGLSANAWMWLCVTWWKNESRRDQGGGRCSPWSMDRQVDGGCMIEGQCEK